jgi:hypothetical protein
MKKQAGKLLEIHVECLLFLSDLNQKWNPSTHFRKKKPNANFMKIRYQRFSIDICGQTNGQIRKRGKVIDEILQRFIVNTPQIVPFMSPT